MTEPDRALDPTAPASVPPARLAPRVRNSRVFQWAVAVGAAVIAALGIVLLFLLAQATNNRELYERNYERLFIVNMVVASRLLAVIGWGGWRLLARLRQGKFGSRLLMRLALIFALGLAFDFAFGAGFGCLGKVASCARRCARSWASARRSLRRSR
jgi:NhaP-type Na+/H+ or K+/H+ antiporter